MIQQDSYLSGVGQLTDAYGQPGLSLSKVYGQLFERIDDARRNFNAAEASHA